jgi:hypothetical protein
MAPGRLWRVAVLAAFLIAQQSALAHQSWHAASAAQAASTGNTNPLCDQHGALDAVLGALSGPATLPLLDEVSPVRRFAVARAAADLAALAPSSRGPPASA